MMNDGELVRKLMELEDRTYNSGNDILRKISAYTETSDYDARASSFYILSQLLRSLKIYFILKAEYLSDRDWYVNTYLQKWQQHWPVVGGKYGLIVNDHEILNKDFDQVMLTGYIQLLYSIIESRFRIFTRAIQPQAFNEGTDKFYKIYIWLLDRLELAERYKNLLRLFGLIRNSIHNNGVYMNKRNPQPKPIPYNGKEYTFEHSKAVLLGNAYNLIISEITPDLITMMEKIITSNEIITKPYLRDPMRT